MGDSNKSPGQENNRKSQIDSNQLGQSVFYNMDCNSFNTKLSCYIETIFEQFGQKKQGEMNKVEFNRWVDINPSVPKLFQKNMYFDIWEERSDEVTGKHKLAFSMREPDHFCKCSVNFAEMEYKDVWLKIYSKFMMFFESLEEHLPFSKYE